MPCDQVTFDDGSKAWFCWTRSSSRCRMKGCTRKAVSLCDYPMTSRPGTCDADLCGTCRRRQTRIPGVHPTDTNAVEYCIGHDRWARWLDSLADMWMPRTT